MSSWGKNIHKSNYPNFFLHKGMQNSLQMQISSLTSGIFPHSSTVCRVLLETSKSGQNRHCSVQRAVTQLSLKGTAGYWIGIDIVSIQSNWSPVQLGWNKKQQESLSSFAVTLYFMSDLEFHRKQRQFAMELF